jgi:hypothetical protein
MTKPTKKQKPTKRVAAGVAAPNKQTLPAWIASVLARHPLEDSRDYALMISNWRKMQTSLAQSNTAVYVLFLLAAELGGKNRPDFVSRIYRRFATLRRAEELDELWALYPGAGCRDGKFIR